jgi:bifunctional ADP-heptose synthase (sugar kinase/adenylyltransferase)
MSGMKFRELLLEIRNLDVYSAGAWEEYVEAFVHSEALERYLSQQPHGPSRLLERIKGGRGADAVEADYALSAKVASADVLGRSENRCGLTLGMVSGSFDLLHLGHVKGIVFAKTYLAKYPNPRLCAAALSDESIRAKKGPGRPILNLNERLDLLCHVACVDHIVPLEEPNCLTVLDRLRPDFFFKSGADRAQPIVRQEIELVEGYGGAVIIFPPECETGMSTTGLIKVVLDAYEKGGME